MTRYQLALYLARRVVEAPLGTFSLTLVEDAAKSLALTRVLPKPERKPRIAAIMSPWFSEADIIRRRAEINREVAS